MQRHLDTHTALDIQLNDAWRALRHSLDTAIVEIEDLEQSTSEERAAFSTKAAELAALVTQALVKAESAISDCPTIYATIFEGMLAEIAQDREQAMSVTRKAIANADRLSARLHFAASTLRKKFLRRLHQVWQSGESKMGVVQQMARRVRVRVESLWLQLKEKLGLGKLTARDCRSARPSRAVRTLAGLATRLPAPVFHRAFTQSGVPGRA